MRVNEVDGYERLTVSGVCDYATYEAWCRRASRNTRTPIPRSPRAEPVPTESAPTPEPTPVPTQAPVVGPDSDANTISQMQEYLRDALGYLTDGAYTPARTTTRL